MDGSTGDHAPAWCIEAACRARVATMPEQSTNDGHTTSNTTTELARHTSDLAEFELSERRAVFLLTRTELKLLGIAGVGFFLDAYDLFVINPVATMLQYRLYGGKHLPPNLEGFMKAGANIGSVIGQFAFGYAADALGRKAVYGKELMLIILATILTLTTPTGSLSPEHSLIYLAIFRILLGVGVGGDYPMSASITSDRSNLRKRGTMLAYIFSNQGWGSFMGSLITIIVLAAYKHVMEDKGEVSKVDGAWRIVVAVSLVPAFGTLYQRLTLPESTRFKASQKLINARSAAEEGDAIAEIKKAQAGDDIKFGRQTPGNSNEKLESTPSKSDEDTAPPEEVATKKAHFADFVKYFSEWRHAKLLIGTCTCWFLLDIAFYGINLNQNVVLQQIGYDGTTGTPWNRLFKISTGNMIITALGFVPGYYASILTIEKLGRKWIQIQGFLMAALFLGILAGKFHTLSKPAFIVNFAFLQFFFNFGANTTTYCYPAEVFPTRYRATAHGLSAAAGKAGAIISALAFNTLSKDIGTPAVLWIFFGCCIAGAGFTLLLPEVKARDPDLILAEEIRAERDARARQQQEEAK
ncbi:putative sugar (and other) transporter [Lyophyllum shimeji]|uniref:Sugar (And other) transporter n=1 Tax=Lyophyllum shimeji TaxID=47721 RepID=A0A9P3Q1C3_LYOSH|nr:putative sugar (and other) transporter [Lyophyllum shimeji]